MTKNSSSFQTNIIHILICLIFLRSCNTRNPFSDLDLITQTFNPKVTGFMVTGNANNDWVGSSVKTAGDINNDGYDDIIIGARQKNSNQGAVYVIYGGEESAFLDIDLSITSLNPLTTGFMITGNAVGDNFGFSVSTAGDIDNDGYDDIIIGAYQKNTAYVIYGGPKSTMSNILLSSTTLNPTSTGFKIIGNAAGDALGRSVSAAGDINKDGYDDIIVGAPGKSSSRGAVYVIYGGAKSTMSNIDLSITTLNPTSTGFTITGNAAGDNFGWYVSTAGDFNNDGFSDIIFGAYLKNGVQGAAYVIYGRAKSTMTDIALSSTTLNPLTTGFTITGSAANEALGVSVSTAGDVNNDGYDDIVIGASYKNNYQGAAYVIYGGSKSSMSNWDFSSGVTLNPLTTGFMIAGDASGDRLGGSVSTAGDVNNDGYDDIIIGANRKNTNYGAAYVIYGGQKSTMSNIALSSTSLDLTSKGFMISANAANDYLGYAVSTAGDINKDGYDDIIIGANQKNSGKGAAYVIYASCSTNCKQCSGEAVCTQCKNSYLMYQSKCFASCPDGTRAASPTICEDCSANCKRCSSSASVCDECKSSYILYLSQCLDSCPDGMFLSTTTGTCEDCQSPCSKCTSITACTECISPLLLYTSGCLPSCPKAMFNFNNVCKDCPSYCSSCISQDSCQVCYEGYTLSDDSLCVMPSSLQYQQRATQAISSATQGIGSVVCVGSTVFPFSALVSKIVQNTRYLNLSVTIELAEVYQTWDTDFISWDIPNLMSDLDHFETSPPLFAHYGVSSPFLVNFWSTLLNIGIGFGVFIVCTLLIKLFEHEKYEGWAYSLVRKLVGGSFNFALVQAYACLDDILFSLIIDARTNPFNSFFSWASMICAVLFLVLGCLLVFFNFWTVFKYQSIKKQGTSDEIEAFNERNQYWELFYSDFNDDDLWGQSFFAILIIRSSISSIIIAVIYDYPLMQASYLIILDAVILLFLLFKTPFNTLRGTLAQYYYEIITLLVHLCAFILALQDSSDNPSNTVRQIMSKGILYLNTALISGAIGFMFIEIYKTISEKKRAARLKKRQIVPEENKEAQNFTETADPLRLSNAQTKRHSIEKLYFRPENDQKPNYDFTNIESNFNANHSRELDIYPSHMGNQQRSTLIRHRKRGNRSIFPNNATNNDKFSNH